MYFSLKMKYIFDKYFSKVRLVHIYIRTIYTYGDE